MPKRTDLKTILLIGSGPIVIGQACEFDYSGTQACKALREEGYRIVLVNSNPATIMTDPETADRTYIEPITWEIVRKIIEKERPDALLPTLGGQTALNCAMELHHHGVLEEFNVEMIGARPDVIERAENRQQFKDVMATLGIGVPKSGVAHNLAEAQEIFAEIGQRGCVLRPSYTLGGTGGGLAFNKEEFNDLATRGLDLSPTNEVLIEQCVQGWKEYEMEVMRDKADNVVIVCAIENFDPMGVHTGDSITVAPAQTLSDKEYQLMRDASLAIIRAIGVETGGSNIQFAIDPDNGDMVAIEMNPRVSRSSALASKATGFPIAKIAAKLAVGYRLDELKNDITRETPACFEPTIDYVVTKIPRWNFEKFPDADPTLTTQMKSVGETMAIGRTFKESFQKALRGLETGRFGLGCDRYDKWGTERMPNREAINKGLSTPNEDRPWFIRYALKSGMSIAEVHERTQRIDPWFLHQIQEILDVEEKIRQIPDLATAQKQDASFWLEVKQHGFSDRQLSWIWRCSDLEVRKTRIEKGVEASFKLVDTCAAEFEAFTPYYYSSYEAPIEQLGEESTIALDDETRPQEGKDRIMILGGGPNRIGQGIEFDYCCCQAAFALHNAGYETIMVNSNPETVSTDYDTSDHLFFEPLTVEDVLNICDRMKPKGVIVQFGGQTPLNLARGLEAAGVPIVGTSVDSIDRAEDRQRFQEMVHKLGLRQPANDTATEIQEAVSAARRIEYPILVRPSYVLGGRAMEIVYDEENLRRYLEHGLRASEGRAILIDQFLEDAIEVDVDCLSDGQRTIIGGVMQHIEEAGVHSGDSACVLPPHSLPPEIIEEIKRQTRAMAQELNVRGLMNVQFAVKETEDGENQIFVLEVNPRASRTVPFVSKATGVPLARYASLLMVGKTMEQIEQELHVQLQDNIAPNYYSVKESVFPFNKFAGVDIILGPEMRSTGEVMGIDDTFPLAFAKSQLAANSSLPPQGKVFISVANQDKQEVIPIARHLVELGYSLLATRGTARVLEQANIGVETIPKLQEGARPNLIDFIKNGEVVLVINTPSGHGARTDEGKIRAATVYNGITCITTLAAAQAAVDAYREQRGHELSVTALQDRY